MITFIIFVIIACVCFKLFLVLLGALFAAGLLAAGIFMILVALKLLL